MDRGSLHKSHWQHCQTAVYVKLNMGLTFFFFAHYHHHHCARVCYILGIFNMCCCSMPQCPLNEISRKRSKQLVSFHASAYEPLWGNIFFFWVSRLLTLLATTLPFGRKLFTIRVYTGLISLKLPLSLSALYVCTSFFFCFVLLFKTFIFT